MTTTTTPDIMAQFHLDSPYSQSLSSRRSSRSSSISPVSTPRPKVRRRDYYHDPKRRTLYRLFWGAALVSILYVVVYGGCRITLTSHEQKVDSVPVNTIVPVTTTTTTTVSPQIHAPELNVVHVIQTRLMQHQPDLVELGLGRLQIFRTLCLPTMVAQSNQNFLWIIRTDPLLNTTLKEQLVEMVQPYSNFALVASNYNPEGFRGMDAISDISQDTLWSGSLDLIEHYHTAAKSTVVLESRLDADDGVHHQFVDYMQDNAPGLLVEPNSWMVWCAQSHLEWHANSPFRSQKGDSAKGYLVGIKHSGCVTPGLTMAYGIGVSRSDLPRGTHHFLHKVLPPCDGSKNPTSCLARFSLKPGAIRARTPTSAGMANLWMDDKQDRAFRKQAAEQERLQEKMWEGAEALFQIQRDQIAATKTYLSTHLPAIAAENLKGQCTKGHSCKEGAKQLLQRLLNQPVEGNV